ncbi:MAG: aminotransferase class I/II-fold pyridoxal phosphate-dependent enzyme, partial [Sphingobacteriales bacterium]|nr:aminotransferase class I/II-fold pyridoxal phosphate-dependent enzyme [Sphingobacteriales bacterium]
QRVNDWIKEVVAQKELLMKEFTTFSYIKKVYPSDANFILIKVEDAAKLYTHLSDHEVIVRNRSKDFGCENTLRITIGTPEENEKLINLFRSYEQ